MTINPHLTDQILAVVAEKAKTSQPPIDLVPSFVAMLREQLPGADEKLVGEIVMHAASLVGRLGMVLEQRGYAADTITPLAVVALSGAGAVLYRGGAS